MCKSLSRRGYGKRKKILTFILTVAMLLTIPEIPVLAETINTENMSRASARQPANPVHHCSEDIYNWTDDTTDWSYVYFGSYPQTEVSGDALTAAITNANYDANGDALVDGIEYRRITKNDTTSASHFGSREYRYFKWEPIKWKVLQNNGSTLFLAADMGIDCKRYNEYNENESSVTWEQSTIRQWLNSTFYTTAFTSTEQAAIVKKTLVNNDHPGTGTEGGNDTEDKVFLLSFDEVRDPSYGFCSYAAICSRHRWIKPTDYAYVKGTANAFDASNFDDFGGSAANCLWWLRSPGYRAGTATAVTPGGFVNLDYGHLYYESDKGVVPALQINLASNLWSIADNETPPEPGNKDSINPVHHCTYKENTDTTDWHYVYFGSYPQTEITGNDLTSAIIEAEYNITGDTWVKGIKYRRVKDTGTNGTYRYFKWERIKWRVLNRNVSTSTLFLVADKGMDVKVYNNKLYASATWEDSTLRKWLNNSFYTTAFSSNEQNAVVEQRVRNEDNPQYGTEGGNDTRDKVYLLSIGEATDPYYGFCSNSSTKSVSRIITGTDYAHAKEGSSNEWWLRSPGGDINSVATAYSGVLDLRGYSAAWGMHSNERGGAVVPVLHVQMDSDFLYTEDDGSSGEGGSNADIGEEIAVSLDKSEETLIKGKTLQLSAQVSPSDFADNEIVWSSSAPEVASVNAMGLVSAKNIGTAMITAEVTGFDGVSASCLITVETNEVKVSSITLYGNNKPVTEGSSLRLMFFVSPYNATNQALKWSSSDTTVATVDATGLVTAIKAGNVTITATATDGSYVSGKCEITVEKQPEEEVKVNEITLDKTSGILTEGDTLKLTSTVTPANATNKNLSWSSSDTTVATVDAAGLVTAVKAGTTTITVTSTDGSDISASCEITVEKQPEGEIKVRTIALSQTTLALQEGQTSKITATVSPDNAKNKDLQWISSDTTIATVDTTGMITAKKAGIAMIIVLATDGSGAKASCELTVERKTEDTPQPPENSTAFSYRKAIAKASVSFAEGNLYYTGAPVIPQMTVSYEGQELIPDTDYTVSYENNINIGNAKATIEGIGAYSGKKIVAFPIKEKIGANFAYNKGKYKILNSSEVSYQGITSAKTKKVQIPQVVILGNKYFKVTKIEDNALKNTRITSVVIGNQVKSIGKSAFQGCKSLNQVVIGKNVSKVGKKAFYNCKKLKKITIYSTKLKAKNVGSGAYKGIYAQARIEVPTGKAKEYKKWLKSKGAGSKIKVVEK